MPNQQQKMRKEYLYTAFMCIGITVLIIILIIVGGCEPQTQDATSEESVSKSDTHSSAESKGGVSSENENSKGDIEISLPDGYTVVDYPSAGKMTGILALTDAEYMTTVSEEPPGLVNIYSNKNGSYGLSGNNLCLDEYALKALDKMIEAFDMAKGENNLIVGEAFVPGAEVEDPVVQKDLSNGYTVSFSIWPPDEDGEVLGGGKYIWLVDNCTRFGYILRYPSEKVSYTQVSGNGTARIYRYVGYEHAAYMAQWHLCLEEYIDAVRNTSYDAPLTISYKDQAGDQKTCFVYYVKASDGETTQLKIRGGEEAVYTVSGDGSEGFIITCYE